MWGFTDFQCFKLWTEYSLVLVFLVHKKTEYMNEITGNSSPASLYEMRLSHLRTVATLSLGA